MLQHLLSSHLSSRIWGRDVSAFAGPTSAPSVQRSVETRLGWLDAPTAMDAHVDEIERFAGELQRDGLTSVYLLGMGGSSLSAEVLREGHAGPARGLQLVVLDTTDERRIRQTTESLDPMRAFFLVSSKSGTTIEVTSLERHFRATVAGWSGAPGRHFAAITDPGTPLVGYAAEHHYRHVFLNPPDIGGRYSALSLFGLVPAATIGLDIRALLASARRMADQCHANESANPGLALGAFMATHAAAGRDKLTILAAGPLAPLGVWIEQLIAESTGKNGRGILPVVGEPIGKPAEYGADRAFVALLTPDAADVRTAAKRLEDAGHPVYRITTTPAELGGEFFRWDFATAVAGAALGVNPFDEPNVREAKERTQAQLDARKATGTFRMDPPFERGPGYSRREHQPDDRPAAATRGRYLAILDYLPADPRRAAIIERIRVGVRQRSQIASTHGIGPRYLHSTGQYHKGGPNTGTFLLITAADESATPVPGTDFTFSALKQAQALGDFDALAAAGRHVIHYHLDNPVADISAQLEKVAFGLT
jgi:glucose-6-phosphate isomerase